MSNDKAAKNLRQFLEKITGLKTKGIITSQLAEGKNPIFNVAVLQGTLSCLYQGNGWVITLFDKSSGSSQDVSLMWMTYESPQTKNALRIIPILVKDFFSKSIELTFVKEIIDYKNDTARKTFDSNIGLIIQHTRRTSRGVETAIEIKDSGKILNFELEGSKSNINSDQIRIISQLPF